MNDPAILICTDMPDLSNVAIERYDWSKTAYAGYADSNLCHNILDGNQTPFDWYSKKQAATETDTYGAKGLRYTSTYVYIPDKISPSRQHSQQTLELSERLEYARAHFSYVRVAITWKESPSWRPPKLRRQRRP